MSDPRGPSAAAFPVAPIALCVLALYANGFAQTAHPPKIDYVVPLSPQPFAQDPNVIWYDPFDSDAFQRKYAERSGTLTTKERLGGRGKSLWMHYPRGHRGIGNRKVFFGDSPVYPQYVVKRGQQFTDVYWRVYVKHQRGWRGRPAKMSRATSLAGPRWQQAMIAHVWSGSHGLTLDPASGIRRDRVVTRRYNDFSRLRWLGNRPASKFLIHATEESGRWVCVESRARLNTPGKSDGYNALWIDGFLQTDRKNLAWRGSYTRHGINAVFLEAYWNRGSPVDQSRWMDEFVISTQPIGPVYAPPNPELVRTRHPGAEGTSSWEVEVACRLDRQKPHAVRLYERGRSGRRGVRGTVGEDVWGEVVWKSNAISRSKTSVKITTGEGKFAGAQRQRSTLEPKRVYFCRIRQKDPSGRWSGWSAWHQPFQTK